MLYDRRSAVNDQGDELHNVIAVVGDAVAGTVGTERHVTGGYGAHRAVVVIVGFPFQHIVQFGVAFVNMESDAAARIQRDTAEEPAFIIQFLFGCKIDDMNSAIEYYQKCINNSFDSNEFKNLTSFIIKGYIYGYYTIEQAEKISNLFEAGSLKFSM